MGASIWSMSPKAMLGFPIHSFVDFCEKHCLLQWDRPVWRTVTGGSRNYVEALTAGLRSCIKLSTAATRIQRFGSEVNVWDDKGHMAIFDHVIMASHSDQSLALIDDPCNLERSILGAIRYKDNDVWLHCDPQLMPKRKQAWAAWNVLQQDNPEQPVCLTYWMNILQNIDRSKPVFVTLNPATPPRSDMVFGRYSYAHPQYDEAAIAAQARLHEIQGVQRIWFCGAWTGYGFHEDGLVSGLNVARMLGAKAPWHKDNASDLPVPVSERDLLTEAAE
jgi:predicted NAD/FAD-binding protein